jgi:hypothetical protein
MASQWQVLRTAEEALPGSLKCKQSMYQTLYRKQQHFASWHSRCISPVNEARAG